MLHASDLNQRVTFQANTGTSRNSHGDVVANWVDQFTVWASVVPQPNASKEVVTGGQLQSGEVIVVRVRYRSTIVPQWRLTWGGMAYHISQVSRINGAVDALEITAQTGVVHGD